jgi:hypothetical protein
MIAFICVGILSIYRSFKTTSRLYKITDLWSMPSYKLHEKLEDHYSSSLKSKSMKKKYKENHAGRYKSVTYKDDVETKTRTITIIEDLTKVPPKKDEEEEERKDKKKQENIPLRTLPQQDDGRNAPSWTPTGQAWARSQARDVPLPKPRESAFGGRANVNVAPATTYVAPTASSAESRAVDGEQQDMSFPPLIYNGQGQGQGQGQQHTWTDYV